MTNVKQKSAKSKEKINALSTQNIRNTRTQNIRTLDTLAQLGTNASHHKEEKPANPYYKRAIAKYLTNEIILPLVDLNSPLKKSYWNSYHCVETLLQNGKTITGRYCNNRWCVVCGRIRAAKMINGYAEVIKTDVPEPYFVTLTIRNMKGDLLEVTIDGMISTINRINNLLRHRRNHRIVGIRKLEVTYNSKWNDFHPHFHFILNSRRAGLALISRWMDTYPDQAVMDFQDIRKADDNTIIELFKYFTKLGIKSSDRVDGKAVMKIHVRALDTIFQAMWRRRVYQPMGLKKAPVSEDIDEIESQVVEELKEDINVWAWIHEVSDWVTADGELLTGCNARDKYKILRC